MLGGQVDNRVFVPDEMAKVLPGFKSYHANTVEFPVPWKLIEPKEGQFEFAAFDQIVRDIRAHGLRAIVLWFGTWKGDETTYLPDWISPTQRVFQRRWMRTEKRRIRSRRMGPPPWRPTARPSPP